MRVLRDRRCLDPCLVGDGSYGQAERIQTFRCQACHSTFTARRYTPLYRLNPPSQQVAVVLSALAEGLDASAAERIFGYRQTPITTWLSRAGEHVQSLHEHYFHALQIPHLQWEELRSSSQVRLSLVGHRSPHEAASCA